MPITRNPILPGFNPDPSCVRVEGVYYAVTSTFEYLPALPVYRSDDLDTWTHIGNVADRESQVGLAEIPSGFGVWAPTIRYRDGVFYVIVSIAGSPRGCVVYTATDPAGPWSDGITIDGVRGIDPDIAWDDDGRVFVTYSGLIMDNVEGWSHHGILQVEVDLDRGIALEEPRSLWSGTGLTAPEAPHVYLRDTTWFLVIAEGGTSRGHSVSVARSERIQGPYEGCPSNPVLSAGGSDRSIVSTGHADLITAPDGTDMMLLLATRTVSSGTFSPIGRESFLTPVTWVDGWPIPAVVEYNPSPEGLEETFDFSAGADVSDPGWLAVAQPPQELARPVSGALELVGAGVGLESPRPVFVGRRQRHLESSTRAVVDVRAGEGGLALRFDEHSFIELFAVTDTEGGALVTGTAVTPSATQRWETRVPDAAAVVLALETALPDSLEGRAAADSIRLRVGDGDSLTQLAQVDGRAWSVEVAAPFTGRIIGVAVRTGTVRVSQYGYHGAAGS